VRSPTSLTSLLSFIAVLVVIMAASGSTPGATSLSAQEADTPTPTTVVPTPEPTDEPTVAPTATSVSSTATSQPSPSPTPTSTPTPAPSGPPWILSDKEDYAPGEEVILTGGNWRAGESIEIVVDDDGGSIWRHQVAVVADSSGRITNTFMLPDWFVATYTVVATGETSGMATTTFTDGNVQVRLAGGPTSASIAWLKFNTVANCSGGPTTSSGSPTAVNSTSFTTLTGVDGPGGPNPNGQSIRITAPATIGAFTFSGWTGAVTSSSNPLCLAGSSGTQQLTANYVGAGATKLAFTTPPRTGVVNQCLDVISVQTRNASDTATNVTSNTTVSLASSNMGVGGAGAFYSDAACTTAITSVLISTGSSTASFYYKATGVGDGGHDVTVSASGLTSATETQTINKANQVITFTSTAPVGAVYGDVYIPTATGGASGNSIVFGASGACGYSTGTVTMNALGSCTVTANQAGNDDYNAASEESQVFAVGQAALSITASSPADINYGDPAPTVTPIYGGFVLGENETVLTTPPTCGSDYTQGDPVGTYTTSCSGAAATNYMISYFTGSFDADPAALSITASSPADITYGDPAPTVTPIYDGFVLGENETVLTTPPTCGSDYTQGDPVGTYTTSCSGAAATNYMISYFTGSFDVVEADPDCTSIIGGNFPYDGLPHGATGQCLGVLGETLTGLDLGASFTDVPGGTANWTFTDVTGNYNDDAGSVEIVITQKDLTVTGITAADKPWDGNTSATLDVSGAALVGVVSGDSVALNTAGATGVFTSSSVGTQSVFISGLTISGSDVGNYNLIQPVTSASILAWDAAGYGFYQPVGVTNSVFVAAPGYPPVAPTGVWNTVKGGQTVPLKFNVFAGAVEKTSVADIKSFTTLELPVCGTGTWEDAVEIVTTGNTELRYDAVEGQFVQNWKTPKVPYEKCFRVTVKFQDGSSISAFFKLKK
jgi:hypothetical protein